MERQTRHKRNSDEPFLSLNNHRRKRMKLQRNSPTATLLSLNNDILHEIFQILALDDRMNLAETCCRLEAVSQLTFDKYRKFEFTDVPKKGNDHIDRVLFHIGQHLTSVIIRYRWGKREYVLSRAGEYVLSKAAENCVNLKSLIVAVRSVPIDTIIDSAPSRGGIAPRKQLYTQLELSQRIGGIAPRKQLPGNVALVDRKNSINNVLVTLSECGTLRELSLSRLEIHENTLPPHLTVLQFSYFEISTSQIASIIQRLQSLKKFVLSDCTTETSITSIRKELSSGMDRKVKHPILNVVFVSSGYHSEEIRTTGRLRIFCSKHYPEHV